MAFRNPADGYSFPDEFNNPPVMAIGDSIYNGMRSATINAEFASKSVPAMVSRVIAPDYPFRTPRYPEVLLVDVEQTLREIDLGDLFSRLKHRLRLAIDNAKRWASGVHVVPLAHCAWDNLAQAGAEIDDVITHDAAHWDQMAADILPKLDQITTIEDFGTAGFELIDLHMALNGRFLLNPNNRPELNGLRQIDLVNLRKPAQLLVNLGSNHGLLDITLSGSESGAAPGANNGLRSLAAWAERMREVAEHLTALPPDTRHIYVNTLILPSSVPNMMYPYNPREIDASDLQQVSGYFPVYDNRFGGLSDYTQYSGRKMREIDDAVRDINETMMANMRSVFDARGDDRLHFFRVDEAMEKFDGKHKDSKAIRRTTAGARLEHVRLAYTNKAIDFDNFFIFDSFREGGLCSLDNHHPSGLGYTIMARELLRAMREHNPGIKLNRAPISENGDRLFSDPPGAYADLVRILYQLRRKAAGFTGEPDLDEARGAAAASSATAVTPDREEAQADAFVKFICSVICKPG